MTLADDINLRIEAEDGLAGPSFGFLGRAMQLLLGKGEEQVVVAAVRSPRNAVYSRMLGQSHLQYGVLAERCERDGKHKEGIW